MLQFPDKTNVPNMADVINTAVAMHTAYLKNQASSLANQSSAATLPYAGPQAAAALGQTQAQTGLVNTQARLMPQQVQNQRLSALGQFLKYGNPATALYNFRKAAGNTATDNVVQNNSQDYANAYDYAKDPVGHMMNTVNQLMGGGASGSSGSTQPQGQTPASNSGVAGQIQQGAANSYQTETHTPSQNDQIRYVQQASDIYNKMGDEIKNVGYFAGRPGMASKTLAQIGASFGKNDPVYTGLMKYMQDSAFMSSETRRLLGAQATDSETKILDQTTIPSMENMTAEQVVALHNNLGQVLNHLKQISGQTVAQGYKSAASSKFNTINDSMNNAFGIKGSTPSSSNGFVNMKGSDGKFYRVPQAQAKSVIADGGSYA